MPEEPGSILSAPAAAPPLTPQDELEARFRKIIDEDEAFKKPVPDLYHYTDSKGVHGILTSKQLWMKADDETRDPLELRYANEAFSRAWTAEQNPSIPLDSGELAQPDPRVGDLTEQASNPFSRDDNNHAASGVYFVSFCPDRDVPHHWQNFGAGGRGFSIGFYLTPALEGWTIWKETTETKLWLRPVCYEEKEQQQLLRKVLQDARLAQEDFEVGDVQRALRQVVGELLPFFKHGSFAKEGEWRVVGARETDHTASFAEVQVVEGRLTAHLKLRRNDGTLPVVGVVVGPRAPVGALAHVQALLPGKVRAELSKWS